MLQSYFDKPEIGVRVQDLRHPDFGQGLIVHADRYTMYDNLQMYILVHYPNAGIHSWAFGMRNWMYKRLLYDQFILINDRATARNLYGDFCTWPLDGILVRVNE